jgi:hypothetical protein
MASLDTNDCDKRCFCCWCEEVEDEIVSKVPRTIYDDPVFNDSASVALSSLTTTPTVGPVRPISAIANDILQKPNIITRDERLVIPALSGSGEIRENGMRSEMFPVREDDPTETEASPPSPPQPPIPPIPVVPQYTPTYSPGGVSGSNCVNYQTGVTNSYSGLRHDPDGIYWIAPSLWVAAQWDGVTVWDPATLTVAQVSAGIFPTVNTMRGLRELFYEKNPFADVQNPTVAEIDNWNIEVLRHFRRLLGRFESDPVYNDKALYYQAHWAVERRTSTVWDSRYPADPSKPGTWGPCGGSSNPHCGASFVPDCVDQIPYFASSSEPCVTDTSFAEGIFSVNTNLPWSIKFARTIAITLLSDGLGGHTAPFLGTRSRVGLAWSCGPTTSSLTVKWSGDSNTPPPPVPPVPSPPVSLVQYTPDYSPSSSIGSVCINAQTAAAVAAGQRHDPAGVTWISQAQWDAALWDGVPFNPCGKTGQEIYDFCFPNPFGPNIKAMRGLRQLYEQLNPFADVLAPTVAEIDYWNTEVLRHLRRLLGLSEANYPLSNDKACFYRAHWCAERQWTTIWDSRYPADPSKPFYGPCNGYGYLHCGYGFTPDCVDQAPYLMNGDPCVVDPGTVEGAFTALMDQPWCMKLALILGNTIKGEALGGHMNALLRKPKIGFNWTCQPPIVQVRIILGGVDAEAICP